MRTALLAAVAAATLFGDPAWADCSVPRFSFLPSKQVEATMSTSSGQSCSIRLRASETSRFDKVAVVARPRHGTAAAGIGGGVTYRSKAGYAGDDVFVFAVTGKMKTGNGTARIRVSVSVVGEGSANVARATSAPLPRTTSTRADAKGRSIRAQCRRASGPFYHDPQRRVWYGDNRYFNFYLDCVARREGFANKSNAR